MQERVRGGGTGWQRAYSTLLHFRCYRFFCTKTFHGSRGKPTLCSECSLRKMAVVVLEAVVRTPHVGFALCLKISKKYSLYFICNIQSVAVATWAERGQQTARCCTLKTHPVTLLMN